MSKICLLLLLVNLTVHTYVLITKRLNEIVRYFSLSIGSRRGNIRPSSCIILHWYSPDEKRDEPRITFNCKDHIFPRTDATTYLSICLSSYCVITCASVHENEISDFVKFVLSSLCPSSALINGIFDYSLLA